MNHAKTFTRPKVTVAGGAGNVGSTIGHYLAMRELADVILVDILETVQHGKGLDISQACPMAGSDSRIAGTKNYQDTANSDIVIITAGIPRKPGMSRDDLLNTNAKIVGGVVEQIVAYSPNCILIIVSNPLDAMTQLAFKRSGFPRERVIGMAGTLDAARFRAFIAQELNVSVENIHACVLGGHGDTMVPLPRFSTVAGIPITELLPQERIDALVKRTAGGGGEIVSLLGTGSAYYAPAASVVEIAEAILKDKKKILPCSVYLHYEYGIRGLCVGVPVKLGARGVESIIEIPLTTDEAAALRKSAAAVKELTALLGV